MLKHKRLKFADNRKIRQWQQKKPSMLFISSQTLEIIHSCAHKYSQGRTGTLSNPDVKIEKLTVQSTKSVLQWDAAKRSLESWKTGNTLLSSKSLSRVLTLQMGPTFITSSACWICKMLTHCDRLGRQPVTTPWNSDQ